MRHGSARVGVIGCGSIGQRYAEWLFELGAEVAVHDVNPEKMECLTKSGIAHFCEIADFFAWGPEKVVVATPPLHHRDAAIMALSGGADVLVEKPFALNIADIEEIYADAKRYGQRVWGVCNMRFHPAIETIKRALPKIGKPLSARAHFSHRLSQMRPAGVSVYAASAPDGGGVILDCIHEVDLMQWLLGPISRVRGWSGRIGQDRIEADDIADLQVELQSGCHGTIHFDFLSRLRRRGMEIIGTDSTLIWQATGRRPEAGELVIGDHRGEEVLWQDDSVDGEAQYRAMLKAFLDGGEGLQTPGEALRVVAVALAAHEEDWSIP